jgi:hypothetical protein
MDSSAELEGSMVSASLIHPGAVSLFEVFLFPSKSVPHADPSAACGKFTFWEDDMLECKLKAAPWFSCNFDRRSSNQ